MTDTLTKTLRSGFLIIAFSLLLSLNAKAQTCGTPPSCDSLGYTQTVADCGSETKALKCPFDTSKMFCASNLIPATNCEIGDILYYDSATNTKSCSRSMLTKKTAIGVVFSKEERLAVALSDAGSTMYWSPGGKHEDVTGLSNCTDGATVWSCTPNGKDNTSKIVAQYGNSTNYAAGYCADYVTSGTSKGEWYLPSMAELKSIYNAKTYVNASLQLLGKSALTENYYWSSTEANYNNSWVLGMINGDINYSNKYNNNYVRAVVAF